MVFEYNLMTDLNKSANSDTSTFYIIGALMLLGGIFELIKEINSENGFLRILVASITLLGGICFVIIANRGKKTQKNAVKYSIQVSEEKIITKHGNDHAVKEMLTSDISKIDFNSENVHISGKNNNKIVVDLGLISPEKKKNELLKILGRFVNNK